MSADSVVEFNEQWVADSELWVVLDVLPDDQAATAVLALRFELGEQPQESPIAQQLFAESAHAGVGPVVAPARGEVTVRQVLRFVAGVLLGSEHRRWLACEPRSTGLNQGIMEIPETTLRSRVDRCVNLDEAALIGSFNAVDVVVDRLEPASDFRVGVHNIRELPGPTDLQREVRWVAQEHGSGRVVDQPLPEMRPNGVFRFLDLFL